MADRDGKPPLPLPLRGGPVGESAGEVQQRRHHRLRDRRRGDARGAQHLHAAPTQPLEDHAVRAHLRRGGGILNGAGCGFGEEDPRIQRQRNQAETAAAVDLRTQPLLTNWRLGVLSGLLISRSRQLLRVALAVQPHRELRALHRLRRRLPDC